VLLRTNKFSSSTNKSCRLERFRNAPSDTMLMLLLKMCRPCRLVKPANIAGPIALMRLLYRYLVFDIRPRDEKEAPKAEIATYSCCSADMLSNAPSAIEAMLFDHRPRVCRFASPRRVIDPTAVKRLLSRYLHGALAEKPENRDHRLTGTADR
jgi:hypothetical protein